MEQPAPAVEVQDLSHRFGRRRAVSGVGFRVAPGEIVGLLGPNGGGKTTLFRILATLLKPDTGRAAILGRSVLDEPHAVRSLIGVVFQRPSLDLKLTVGGNLLHHGHLYGIRGDTLARHRRAALDALGIGDRARDRVETLSGGLQRRVELAKVLIHRPPVLLLDEPSTGLDPVARRDLFGQLENLRRQEGTTVLLTTHILEEAERCDKVGILDRGSLVAYEDPRHLKQAIGGDVLVVRSRDPRGLGQRIQQRFGTAAALVDGTLRIEAPRGHHLLGDVIEAFPGEIMAASWGQPTLEDVFVHLTGRQFNAGEARS